ncbi:MAG: hypothetical protein V4466_06700 [Pseudomonadota bacterium]
MILSVLAVSTLMFAAAPDTALAYAEASARAERYEDDAAARRYRDTVLGPVFSKAMPAIFEACAPGTSATGRPDFTVVLSFKAGKFETVRHVSDHPTAQCVVERMNRVDWPTPPSPDFAEKINIRMGGT